MQVRGLQGSGWQKDGRQYQAYGEAVKQYAEAQMRGVERGEVSPPDLASVRMLLRGLLKQVS